MMEAQSRIQELEAQMERLKEKAAAAGTFIPPPLLAPSSSSSTSRRILTHITVDKCADYEDQIRSLRLRHDASVAPGLPRSNTAPALEPIRPSTSSEDPRPNTATSQKQSRFSFLTNRMGSPFAAGPTTPPPLPPPKDTPADATLLNELERERALRAKAEARAQKVDLEIEELSVQLFSQANEMVAEERRARAKLEERVEMLEKKDRDKMARLERLEKAVTRIDRVKAMLNASPSSSSLSAAAGTGENENATPPAPMSGMLAPPGMKR